MFDTQPADGNDADELAERYVVELRARLDDAAGEPSEQLGEALERGDPSEVSLAEAAGLLEIGSRLDAAAIEAELRDRLLIEMSNAVVDVDTLATEIDLDRSGKELQQRIEGRAPMSIREYASLRQALAARRR